MFWSFDAIFARQKVDCSSSDLNSNNSLGKIKSLYKLQHITGVGDEGSCLHTSATSAGETWQGYGQLSSSSSLTKLRPSWVVSLSLRKVCLIASSSVSSRRTFSRWKERRFWICRMGNGFMSPKAMLISFLKEGKGKGDSSVSPGWFYIVQKALVNKEMWSKQQH